MKNIDLILKLQEEAQEALLKFEEADEKAKDAFRDALKWCFGSENRQFEAEKATLHVSLDAEERLWFAFACPDTTSSDGLVSSADENLSEAVRKVLDQLHPAVAADLRGAIDKKSFP